MLAVETKLAHSKEDPVIEVRGKVEHTEKKLDRVGPVDNRPFTDKLHHFCPQKK